MRSCCGAGGRRVPRPFRCGRSRRDDRMTFDKGTTMETVTLKVNGMSCGGCVASVTRALKATPGVSDAIVRLDARDATVTFDPAQTGAGALRTAIENAG